MDKGKDNASNSGQGDQTAAGSAAPTTTSSSSTGKDARTPTEVSAAPSQSLPKDDNEEEESDYEELDDVLDDFSRPKPATQQPLQQPQQQRSPLTQEQDNSQKAADGGEPQIDEEEMIKQLEAGMAEMMKGAGGKVGSNDEAAAAGKGSGGGLGGDDSWNALAEELSKSGMQPADLMKLMLGEDVASGLTGDDGGGGGDDTTGQGRENKQAPAQSGNKTDAASSSGDNFQDTIQKTMERMQQSGDKATAAANEGEGDDLLMQVLKAMEASGVSADGDGGDENLDKVFMGIMEQLSNKEMLYEPMKELNDKFGPWLKENKDKVSKEDLERYELQSTLVGEIVAKFEEEGFTDDNPEHRAYVWERMQKMQAAGSPPDDLVSNPFGDDTKLQEAMGMGADGPGCPQQ